jgi:hypothetical protein
MKPNVEQELREHLSRLEPAQQNRVVNYARALAAEGVRGVPGISLMHLGIEREDLALIERAIEAGCEQISVDEW